MEEGEGREGSTSLCPTSRRRLAFVESLFAFVDCLLLSFVGVVEFEFVVIEVKRLIKKELILAGKKAPQLNGMI